MFKLDTEQVLKLIEDAKRTYYRKGYGSGFVQGVRKRQFFESIEPQDIKQFIKEFEKRHKTPEEI